MSVLFYLLGIPILLLLLLLGILLFSPLKYRLEFSLKGDPVARFSVALLPLFSLVFSLRDYRFKIVARAFGIKMKLSGDKTGSEKSLKKKGPGKKGLPFTIKLATRENLLHFFGLFRDVYRIFRPRELRISGTLGFSEPHHTAWLFAALSFLPERLQESIHLEPEWDEHLEIEGVVAGSILLFLVLLRAVQFLLSSKTRQIWRHLKEEKKMRQRATRKVKPV